MANDIKMLNQDFDQILAKMRSDVADSDTFRDNNSEGSYLSSLLRQISYGVELLGYMSNAAASESHLDKTKMYENAVALAKTLSYIPKGHIAPLVDCDLTVYLSDSNISPTLVIPRYTSFKSTAKNVSTGDDLYYSTFEDIYFSFGDDGVDLPDGVKFTFTKRLSLVNGYYERINSASNGSALQKIKLVQPSTGKKIGDGFVDVYVYNGLTAKYEQWARTDSLYLAGPEDQVFEVRLNEYRQYEVTFGDGVNGAIPKIGDQAIKVYRLVSDHLFGKIGPGFLTGTNTINELDSRYHEVATGPSLPHYVDINGITYPVASSDFIKTEIETTLDPIKLMVSQPEQSSLGGLPETVSEIRSNAPKTFSTQGSLNSIGDYAAYFDANFSSVLHDSYPMNNWEYMTTYMAQYYDTGGYGIEDPKSVFTIGKLRFSESNVLQMDSCDTNNIYVVSVPSVGQYVTHPVVERIVRKIKDIKAATAEVIITDPVYVNCIPYVSVKKNPASLVSITQINSSIDAIIRDSLSFANAKLGGTINFSDMKTKILGIPGVERIEYMSIVVKKGRNFTAGDVTGNNALFTSGDYNLVPPPNSEIINFDKRLAKFEFYRLSTAEVVPGAYSINNINVATNTVDSIGFVEY